MGELPAAELIRLTGATRKALRVYEARGLLTSPQRDRHGRRRYTQRTVEEVRFIQSARSAGLPLKELKAALEEWRRGQSACPSLLPLVRRRTQELAEQIRALEEQRRRLLTTLKDCACAPQRLCDQLSACFPA